MCTIISEFEGNMNNCLLTYLNEENVNELLTPIHLIDRRTLTSLNENDLVEINENEMKTMKVLATNLLKQWVNLNMGIYYLYSNIIRMMEKLKVAIVI